jgi:nicotinamide-nucleotide amidase
VSVGDDPHVVAVELRRLASEHDLVITTGGLGPTHDDVTREAAAEAFDLKLTTDPRLVELLKPVQARHADPAAVARVLVQAQVLQGAEVIDFVSGTAPARCPAAAWWRYSGLPPECPMLTRLVARYEPILSGPRDLAVVGLSESDAQVLVERAIAGFDGVGFTILARPGDVHVILTDQGGGAEELGSAADLAAAALGDRCYSVDGHPSRRSSSRRRPVGILIAVAESYGGMVRRSDGCPASAVFRGRSPASQDGSARSVAKRSPRRRQRETVESMARGAYSAFGRPDLVIAVTGIAGRAAELPTTRRNRLVWSLGKRARRQRAHSSQGDERQFKRLFQRQPKAIFPARPLSP